MIDTAAPLYLFLYLHLSLTTGGCWGTTEDFTTTFLYFLSSLPPSANSSSVHSLMLSSHLFFCLSSLLPHSTVPCTMVLARPDERETCPYHFSLHLTVLDHRTKNRKAIMAATEAVLHVQQSWETDCNTNDTSTHRIKDGQPVMATTAVDFSIKDSHA